MTSDENVSRTLIPDLGTDAGCLTTLAHMREIVRAESRLPICIVCACDIARAIETFSSRAYADACYAFVKRFMTFREDHENYAGKFGADGSNVEYLQAPSYLLRQEEPVGDCDCYCTLLATLLTIGGVPCSFAVISQAEAPESFSHVYVIAYPPGERLALDASHGDYPGWEYPEAVRFYELPI